MNIHHLELFYYVAKHGGISEAVRNMPLQQQEIDLAVCLLGARPPAGINVIPMFKMPLVLLVPKRSKLMSAEELWQRDRIEESLITVPSNEPIRRTFQDGLAKLKVDWFSGIEVSTVEMVQTYVANGYGIGVTVRVPKMKYHPQVRLLPLEGFELVTFGGAPSCSTRCSRFSKPPRVARWRARTRVCCW